MSRQIKTRDKSTARQSSTSSSSSSSSSSDSESEFSTTDSGSSSNESQSTKKSTSSAHKQSSSGSGCDSDSCSASSASSEADSSDNSKKRKQKQKVVRKPTQATRSKKPPAKRQKREDDGSSDEKMASNPSAATGIFKKIEDATGSRRTARLDAQGNYIPCLGNIGGLIGDEFVMERNGEYKGVAIRLLEDTRPVLTDKRVIKAMTLMEQKEYVLAGKTLWLEKEMTDSGVGILFAVVSKWLEAIGVEVPSEFSEAMLGDLPAPLVAWIQVRCTHPK